MQPLRKLPCRRADLQVSAFGLMLDEDHRDARRACFGRHPIDSVDDIRRLDAAQLDRRDLLDVRRAAFMAVRDPFA